MVKAFRVGQLKNSDYFLVNKFKAERKKFRFFICSVILFSIFVETIKQNNYEKLINELLGV